MVALLEDKYKRGFKRWYPTYLSWVRNAGEPSDEDKLSRAETAFSKEDNPFIRDLLLKSVYFAREVVQALSVTFNNDHYEEAELGLSLVFELLSKAGVKCYECQDQGTTQEGSDGSSAEHRRGFPRTGFQDLLRQDGRTTEADRMGSVGSVGTDEDAG